MTEKKKRFKRGAKYIILAAAAGLFFYVWLQRGREQGEIVRETAAPVIVTRPEYGSLKKVFRITGFTEAETMVTVLPKISGTLITVNVGVGDTVQKGQVIAEVDSESFLLNVRQAEAAYLAAKSTYERMERLYNQRATSKQNYDQAKSQFEISQPRYELAKLQYSYTRITSPLDGVVLEKHREAGSLVAQDIPIVTIGDLDNLIIRAKIPEKYYPVFLEKQETINIEIELPALGHRTMEARVKTLYPSIIPETRSFEIVCTIPGDVTGLRPGMFVNITFALDEKEDIYYLPFSVIASRDKLWFVEKGSDTARVIEFEPAFFNNDYFQVPETYKGYDFIIEGQHFVREGQKVRVLNP